MMFLFHIAFSLTLAVFIAGCALIAWSQRETAAKTLLKVAGYAAVILGVGNTLCIGYYGVRYWEDGYFKAPIILNQSSGMGMMSGSGINMMDMMKMMQGKDMSECPMMKDMMKGQAPAMPDPSALEAAPNTAPTDSEDHEAHH